MAPILIFLGGIGVLLVWRNASDAAFVGWGVVLLAVNLWIAQSAKVERRASEASGTHQTGS